MQRGILQGSKDAAAQAITSTTVVATKITSNSDTQEESDRLNTFRLAAIGVKDAISLSITKFVGTAITNPILWTTEATYFRTINKLDIHSLIKAIINGAERPEAINISQQFMVYKEEDVLITCKGEAIIVGSWDEHDKYLILLVQNCGQW